MTVWSDKLPRLSSCQSSISSDHSSIKQRSAECGFSVLLLSSSLVDYYLLIVVKRHPAYCLSIGRISQIGPFSIRSFDTSARTVIRPFVWSVVVVVARNRCGHACRVGPSRLLRRSLLLLSSDRRPRHAGRRPAVLQWTDRMGRAREFHLDRLDSGRWWSRVRRSDWQAERKGHAPVFRPTSDLRYPHTACMQNSTDDTYTHRRLIVTVTPPLMM